MQLLHSYPLIIPVSRWWVGGGGVCRNDNRADFPGCLCFFSFSRQPLPVLFVLLPHLKKKKEKPFALDRCRCLLLPTTFPPHIHQCLDTVKFFLSPSRCVALHLTPLDMILKYSFFCLNCFFFSIPANLVLVMFPSYRECLVEGGVS